MCEDELRASLSAAEKRAEERLQVEGAGDGALRMGRTVSLQPGVTRSHEMGLGEQERGLRWESGRLEGREMEKACCELQESLSPVLGQGQPAGVSGV